jgi:hypothetical protein
MTTGLSPAEAASRLAAEGPDVVRGDLLLVAEGDRVPADAHLVLWFDLWKIYRLRAAADPAQG